MATRPDEMERSGEGYFASISDLMVGVLFVFLLMLTVFALSFRSAEDDTERLKALVEAQKQKLLEALDLLEGELKAREEARDRMLSRIKERLEERGITVQIDQRSGVLRLGERALRFATGSAEMSSEAQDTADALASVLADVLPCFALGGSGRRCDRDDQSILEAVLVEGHTDRRPLIGGWRFRDNYQLSAERSLTVFRRMMEIEPVLRELRNPERQPLLAVAGYGASRLVRTDEGDDDHAANRRIDLRFVLSSPTADRVRRLTEEIRRLLEASP